MRIIIAIHFPKLKILLMSPFLKAKKNEINNMTPHLNKHMTIKYIRGVRVVCFNLVDPVWWFVIGVQHSLSSS